MEDVLEVYQLPHDPDIPVVCMDEKPVQLVSETIETIPASPGNPERKDYTYERNGVANLFMFVEPLACRRMAHVRKRRTKEDWAEEVHFLLKECYPNAKKVRLICDNLNTHTPGALYEKFTPDVAQSLLKRLEIHYTPKHGSWLNIAEIELSVLSKQCLDRRIANAEILRSEVKAWENNRNQQQTGVDWQFTTEDARTKLKRLYPVVKTE